MVFKLVLDYFKREKYILLGHSYGAIIGQYFARIYPEYVQKIINIDSIVSHNREPSEFKKYLTRQYNNVISIHQKGKSGKKSTYTEEEAIEIIRTGRLNEQLDTHSAKCIARRMLEPVGE